MHRPHGDPPVGSLRRAQHIGSRAGTSLSYIEAKPIALLASPSESHRCEHLNSALKPLLAKRNGIESLDGVFYGNRGAFPGPIDCSPGMSHQLEPQTVWVGKRQNLFVETLSGSLRRRSGGK